MSFARSRARLLAIPRRIASGARWRPLVLAASLCGGLTAGLAAPAAADPVGTGTHPWLIVLCNFSNQQLDPAPASYFNQMYGDPGAGSGKYNFEDWWHDASFGQLSVAGTTVANGTHADTNGWYTVPETRDTWGYSRDRYGKIVDCENAALPDVNYHNYYGVVAIFPEAQGNTTAPLTASSTTMTLDVSSTSPTPGVTTTNYFPTVPFMMNIDDGSGNNAETVDVTAVSGSTFTVTRGVNGTTAKSHNSSAGAGVPGDFGEVTGGSHVGTAPGQSNVTLSDSNTYQLSQVILPNESNLTGAQHETGHGNGYSHSRKLTTSTTDYNDATDVMSAYAGTYEFTTLGTSFGGAVLGSAVNDKGPGLDASNLDFQGWIPNARHYLFTNTPPNQATITLHALSDPNGLADNANYLEARVPAAVTIQNAAPNGTNGPLPPTNPPTCSGSGYGCTTSSYYTVEFRQKTGWDSGFPASAVVLHLFGGDSRSYWVDQTPLGHGGLLYAGDEFVDSSTHTYVGVNSVSGASARVTLGAQAITPSLAYSGDTSGDFNDQITLAGDLTVGGAPVPGKTVNLSVGTQSCSGVTDGTGHATCTLTLTQDPGGLTATASFAGDAAYASASGTAPFTVKLEDTKVAYTGATTGDFHDPATVSGTLVDATDGLPIAGKTLSFGIGASLTDVCSATTDGAGAASCSITPTQAAGPYTMTASFAGDTDFAASADTSRTFTVTKEETGTTYTGPTVILQGASGVTLQGRLLEDSSVSTPIAGRTLSLSLGAQTCTAGPTDANGFASCTLTFTGALGPQPLKAAFLGDAFYLPSSDTTKTAIVFSFPSYGAFVLGDTTVAGAGLFAPVTWWSAGWWTANAVSGGTAPASFKGFALSPSLPTTTPPLTCGGPFTTTPGNSPPPPATVPTYMGVIVAGSVTKSGSTISGTAAKIVVVKVDPGYAPDPGHAGTGVIVATYC
jgi:hypothetical protein